MPRAKPALAAAVIAAAVILASVAYVSSTAATVAPAREEPAAKSNILLQDRQVAQKIHQLVNEERAKNGLQPLLWDDRIATFAEGHSRNIMASGRYADSSDPKDKGDIFYKAIENAICVTEMNQWRVPIDGRSQEQIAQQVVSGWLADGYSKGNLLGPHEKEGVGVALGDEYGVIVQDLC